MKKIKLTRIKLAAFINAATKYKDQVGKQTDKLSHACEKVLEHEANVEVLEFHNKRITKLRKQLDRDKRDEAIGLAQVEAGILLKDEHGQYKFTPEHRKALNKKEDVLEDKYFEDLENIMKENVDFYIPSVKTSDIPANVSDATKKELSILIE